MSFHGSLFLKSLSLGKGPFLNLFTERFFYITRNKVTEVNYNSSAMENVFYNVTQMLSGSSHLADVLHSVRPRNSLTNQVQQPNRQ